MTFTKRKFNQLDLKQRHKKCADLLRGYYERIQRGEALPGEVFAYYNSLLAWMKLNQQQPLILGSQKPLVMASDAFFPFRDCVDEASKMGISSIIQPGGSIRDEDSIRATNEYGMAMVFTGERHFRH